MRHPLVAELPLGDHMRQTVGVSLLGWLRPANSAVTDMVRPAHNLQDKTSPKVTKSSHRCDYPAMRRSFAPTLRSAMTMGPIENSPRSALRVRFLR